MGLGGPEAKEMFRERYGNDMNFMTQDEHDYRMLYEDIAIEVSHGRGMSNNDIFGVTLVFRCPKGKIVSLINDSKLCHSEKEAEDYIKELKVKYRKKKNRQRAVDTDYEGCDDD